MLLDKFAVCFCLCVTVLLSACEQTSSSSITLTDSERASAIALSPNATPKEKLLAGLIEQLGQTIYYDPAYLKIDYPNGDVPIERGVCADVVIRAFRKADIDLQKEVHEDMKGNFSKYPTRWGATTTDRNIDHRRVLNLMVWFDRNGKSKAITDNAGGYLPGDVVTWELNSGLPHTGMVSGIKIKGTSRYAIAHNIGAGAQLEDVLFSWKITGHYRYF